MSVKILKDVSEMHTPIEVKPVAGSKEWRERW